MTTFRVILAADEAIGPRVANLVSRSSHTLVGVATPATTNDGPRSLVAIASTNGIDCMDSRKLGGDDLVSQIDDLQPDVLLNVHSLTKISRSVLDRFPVGAWNLHPGPLPEGAGANVPSWGIALGWDQHGVTLHKMTAEYDDGDISFEDRFPISPTATGLTLSAECSRRGLGLIAALLEQLAKDPSAVPSTPQDTSARRYFTKQQPNNAMIDWNSTASTIESYVRACDFRPFRSPWAAPIAIIDGQRLELLSVEIGEQTQETAGSLRARDPYSVATADRWITLTEVRKVEQ